MTSEEYYLPYLKFLSLDCGPFLEAVAQFLKVPEFFNTDRVVALEFAVKANINLILVRSDWHIARKSQGGIVVRNQGGPFTWLLTFLGATIKPVG
jgi:hypothetical protein